MYFSSSWHLDNFDEMLVIVRLSPDKVVIKNIKENMELSVLCYYIPHLDEVFDNHNHSSTTAAGVQNDVPSSNIQQTNNSEDCESCVRMELKLKKFISKMRASYSNLVKKERENHELDKKIQELLVERRFDQDIIENCVRRVTKGHQQQQTLESELNSERKKRKLIQKKALRSECGDVCKQKKLQLDANCKELRQELVLSNERRETAVQESQKFEQELRHLASMQDKNLKLKENLSDERRVKLELLSALGETKRQLEIRDDIIRNKDKQILELNVLLAQLLAVTPRESLLLYAKSLFETNPGLRLWLD